MVTRKKSRASQRHRKTSMPHYKLYGIWAAEYCRQLFSLRFDRFVVLRVLPILYAMSLIGLAGLLTAATIALFMINGWYGGLFLTFAVPPLMLLGATLLRGLMEFYLALFRVAQHADELTSIHHSLNQLLGIAQDIESMVAATRPFWSFFASSSNDKDKDKKRRDHQRNHVVQARTIEKAPAEVE